MKTNLKGDIVNAAFSRARISGLTRQPTPEDQELALDRLEDMMAEWEESNICVGFVFEEDPDPSTPHGVKRAYQRAIKSNLAVTILADYNKQPHPGLVAEAGASLSSLVAGVALIKELPYPARMPRGSGSTLRWNRYRRFYDGDRSAPLECKTEHLIVNEVQSYFEDYTSFLQLGETIDSYTLTVDQGLTVISESLSSPRIDFTLRADSTGTGLHNFLQAKIVATTSSGRVEIRQINFEVKEID